MRDVIMFRRVADDLGHYDRTYTLYVVLFGRVWISLGLISMTFFAVALLAQGIGVVIGVSTGVWAFSLWSLIVTVAVLAGVFVLFVVVGGIYALVTAWADQIRMSPSVAKRATKDGW
jgi:hypothetical protein